MLNKKQLEKLNKIFHTSIKPVLEKREEELDILMGKVDEYREFVENKNQKSHYLEEMMLASIEQDGINLLEKNKVKPPTEKVAIEKVLQRDIDLNANANFVSTKPSEPSIKNVIKTKINAVDTSGTVAVSTSSGIFEVSIPSAA